MREYAFHFSTYHQKTGIIVKKDILTGKKNNITNNSKKGTHAPPGKKNYTTALFNAMTASVVINDLKKWIFVSRKSMNNVSCHFITYHYYYIYFFYDFMT